MQDSTCLTEKYPGQEKAFWTPCLVDFFSNNKPTLPISTCIAGAKEAPYYESKKRDPLLSIGTSEVVVEPNMGNILPELEKVFGLKLTGDPGLMIGTNYIAGIYPDIVLMKADERRVYMIENKPYSWSEFDGNQYHGGAYIDFVKWLNGMGIRCDYLTVFPTCNDNKLYKGSIAIQKELGDHFGIILLEHIFDEMGKKGFTYENITDWGKYANTHGEFKS